MSNQSKILADILANYLATRAASIRQELEDINESMSELGKIVIGEETETNQDYNPEKVNYQQTEGPSGTYQKATKKDNADNIEYRHLVKDLLKHDGKLTRDGYFTWLFNDQTTVGRKPSKR